MAPDSVESTLRASEITARRGSRVAFAVALDAAGRSIAATQNDIEMSPDTPIVTCAIDEQVDKDLFYGPLVPSSVTACAFSCSR